MSDDDKWTAEATGGFNPSTGQLIIQMIADGASIQLVLDNVQDADSLSRIGQMISTLPETLTQILGGLTSQIADSLGIAGFEVEADPDTPKPTIYKVVE